MMPGKGGQMVRAAGAGAQVVAKEGDLRHPQAAVYRSADGA